ncbi:MAG: 16S rRNA (guanine(966)-N(2))-methyltransferase RsmD [Candidatus Omnitrophota bacterium]
MRITGGKHKSRLLKMPGNVEIRPTQDKVREAVFNIIAGILPGTRILDLYAGTGAFGIEAISRGAESATFVENNGVCVKTIKANISVIGEASSRVEVIKKDAIKALEDFRRDSLKFDIIFLDPPYNKGASGRASVGRYRARRMTEIDGSMAKNSLIKIGACDILARTGFAVVEHFTKDVLPDKAGSLIFFKRKKYGDTIVSFYRSN